MNNSDKLKELFDRISLDWESYQQLDARRKPMRKIQILGWITRAKELMKTMAKNGETIPSDIEQGLTTIENGLNNERR
jgi:transposase